MLLTDTHLQVVDLSILMTNVFILYSNVISHGMKDLTTERHIQGHLGVEQQSSKLLDTFKQAFVSLCIS